MRTCAQGPAAQARQHRGRDDHRRAQFDQERRGRARPGDASDQEGQPVALRDEGAHRRGRRQRSGAQVPRRRRTKPMSSRSTDLLHGKEEVVYADSGYRGAPSRVEREDLHWHIAARPSDIAKMPDGRAKKRVRKRRAPQGERPREGRASVPRDQAPVRPAEGALPRPGEEYGARDHAVRAVEPVDGATARCAIAGPNTAIQYAKYSTKTSKRSDKLASSSLDQAIPRTLAYRACGTSSPRGERSRPRYLRVL